jgi:hypothetical protein
LHSNFAKKGGLEKLKELKEISTLQQHLGRKTPNYKENYALPDYFI